ncbi:MAG: TlpA disulfide reductase family protein [Burkholderiaceae bacterium]
MIGVGPFSIQVVIAFSALVLAWGTARLLARRLADASHRAAGVILLDAMFLALVMARAAYVVQWWEDYAASPRSMIAIGDLGFSWWVGLPVALAMVWWRTRGARMLRRSVLAGIAVGVLAWFAAGGVLGLLQRAAPPLPDLQLSTLDARPIDLASYAGRPVVLNLWASWCAPCRREMPVFEQAQAQYPGVAIVMVNQGESAQQAQAFLEREGLSLENVLLDPNTTTLRAVGSRGLPTTLFFDAQGRLVDSHLGELTMASLRRTLSRRFGQ